MRSSPGMDRLGSEWMTAMRRGDFAAAWKVSDRGLGEGIGDAAAPYWKQPVWHWRPLHGKRVLIACLHGLGDTIQFIRYAPLARQIAGWLAVAAQRELIPLLRTMADAFDELVPANHTDAVNCEVAVEVMELPYIFRSTIDNLPNSVPYFFLEPERPDVNRDILKAGLVWQSGDWDDRRSVPFHAIRSLADVPNVAWYIMQRGAGLADWDDSFGINSGSDDVLEAARVIAGLDLLISVDSMPAHLGGAVATRTWTLLHAQCDWRWMSARQDSPWYPTMRLFRQRKSGDWLPVIARVKKELGAVVENLTSVKRVRFRSSPADCEATRRPRPFGEEPRVTDNDAGPSSSHPAAVLRRLRRASI